MKCVPVTAMLGVTLRSAVRLRDPQDSQDRIVFSAEDGRRWAMYHEQDCCEAVEIADVCGDLVDLCGHPLLVCEEFSAERAGGYETWTFYKFRTVKGTVTVRWVGTSNGDYSEKADFVELPGDGHDRA